MEEKPSKKKCSPNKFLFGESSYLIPGDPWDPKTFFVIFSTSKHFPGSPGIPLGSLGALGECLEVEKITKTNVGSQGSPGMR